MADSPKPPPAPRRRQWALAATRVAWIAAAFTTVLAGLLLSNSFGLYQGSGTAKFELVDSARLARLKTTLRNDPQNAGLKEQIRQLDQQLRADHFRREQLASRGGYLLIAGAAVCIAALQLARTLNRPRCTAPDLAKTPADPASSSARAGRAVAGATVALAGLAFALVAGSHRRFDPPAGPATQPPGTAVPKPAPAPEPATAPDWFPAAPELAANWPRFRGPDGLGITTIPDLPTSWDGPSGHNVRWHSPIPLPGENSPLVWGDRLYLTGANAARREVYCVAAADGAMLWKCPVSTPQGGRAKPPEVLEDTGFAASTAVTDGRRVFAIFANGEVAGVDASGRLLWARHLGTPVNAYGHASSLALWRNRVIVVFDQGDAEDNLSQLLALDAATGETAWATKRPVPNSWSSPILITAGGREQLITCAAPWVIAYDPQSGAELWRVNCLSGDVAPSPVFANGLIYVANDGACAAAIRPDGAGDVTTSHLAWKWDEGDLPDMISLLCDGPRLYLLVFGRLHAHDALTGEHLWEHDLEADFQASPTMVNGELWLLTIEGEMIVGMADADGFKETRRAKLGEPCGASPAFAPGRVFLRGKQHLYCLGN